MGAKFYITGGEDSSIKKYFERDFGILPAGEVFDMLVIYGPKAKNPVSTELSTGASRKEISRKLERLAADFVFGNISTIHLHTQSSNIGYKEGAD